MKNVCAVIVTYANRYHYLVRVMEACRNSGVKKIIVVDNCSEFESRENLRQFENKNNDYVKVLYLSKNFGSSGGYKRGLKYCLDSSDCEYLWLLDDDNCPKKDALEKLVEYWEVNEAKQKNRCIALLSYRSDRSIYRQAIIQNKPSLMLGKSNGFLGFHIMDLPEKVLGRLGLKKISEKTDVTIGEVMVAPYGGLFFNKMLLNTIGYPDESFFVYGDDYDFTLRITKSGGKIFLITESVLVDLEKSFHLKGGLFSSKIINATNTNQCYYMTRNNIRFETAFVSNRPVYYMNAVIYISLNMLFVMGNLKLKSLKNYKAFLKGVYDGLWK